MVRVTSRVQKLTGSEVQRIRQKDGQVKPGVKQETISRVRIKQRSATGNFTNQMTGTGQ
ncbi:unnamed protein product [Staurois parvus]|uniref:Uncharacterized protein n=1 Tax=Staurois parvus TaxID=386267 RepID=A0ABN9F5V6_9NEOB|nr:unnamed protein product [Staurois parvus]